MAKKSKTQRAKASAARAAKKAQEQEAEVSTAKESVENAEEIAEKKPKKAVVKKESAEKKQVKKEEKKPEKKKRFGFIGDVRSELKRVTWPSRQDVMRWSVVVVAALLFFGLYAFGFDNLFQFALTFYSGLGA